MTNQVAVVIQSCGSGAGSVMHNREPVSYTHLDVYKRQIQDYNASIIIQIGLTSQENSFRASELSISPVF